MFPTPLLVLMFFAPESPWWLIRKGRLDQAQRSIERLGRKSILNGTAGETVAMMKRVIELHRAVQGLRPPANGDRVRCVRRAKLDR